MTTNIRSTIRIGLATAALLVGAALAAQPASATTTVRHDPTGAVHFYDDNGQDRGYTWCLSGGAATRCDFYTYEQCRASGNPQFNCVVNPWARNVNVNVAPQRLQLQ